VGHCYNGRILAGTQWLSITPGSLIGTGELLGRTVHVVAACTAYTLLAAASPQLPSKSTSPGWAQTRFSSTCTW